MSKTILGDKATVTALGAKMDIIAILQKVPFHDLCEVVGDVMACVFAAGVPEKDQEKVVDMMMRAVTARLKQMREEMDETLREQLEKLKAGEE